MIARAMGSEDRAGGRHRWRPGIQDRGERKRKRCDFPACPKRARLPDTLRGPGADHNGGGAVIEHRSGARFSWL
jgi:hypothetical protein